VPTIDSARSSRRALVSPFLLLVLLLGLLLAGCGGVDTVDNDTASSAKTEDLFPVDVLSGPTDSGTEVTIESKPASIVSLSPTATEMLWAVGAGDQVVAVDDQSDYPEDVPVTRLSGYEPNIEAILEYAPDLVVATDDTGDLTANLEKAHVPTLLLPAARTLEDTYSQMERLGAATGNPDEAEDAVTEIRDGIEQALEEAPDATGVTYFHELTPDLYTATGETFIGEVYGLFGLENVADQAKTGDDYPQLSREYVVEADPDLVFLADGECCDVAADDVADRPGWKRITAVTDDQIHVVDEDIASRWGPRVLDFVETISTVLTERERSLQTAG
jgi:iron complex transport system substrate-binding protein